MQHYAIKTGTKIVALLGMGYEDAKDVGKRLYSGSVLVIINGHADAWQRLVGVEILKLVEVL